MDATCPPRALHLAMRLCLSESMWRGRAVHGRSSITQSSPSLSASPSYSRLSSRPHPPWLPPWSSDIPCLRRPSAQIGRSTAITSLSPIPGARSPKPEAERDVPLPPSKPTAAAASSRCSWSGRHGLSLATSIHSPVAPSHEEAPAHLPRSPSHRSAAAAGTAPTEPPTHVVIRPWATSAHAASACRRASQPRSRSALPPPPSAVLARSRPLRPSPLFPDTGGRRRSSVSVYVSDEQARLNSGSHVSV
jgi:hypothetical protein